MKTLSLLISSALSLGVFVVGCHTLGLKVNSPPSVCFEIVDPHVTSEIVVSKYLKCISAAFQESPLFVAEVDDATLPPAEVKLRRHFEKSQVLPSHVYYE